MFNDSLSCYKALLFRRFSLYLIKSSAFVQLDDGSGAFILIANPTGSSRLAGLHFMLESTTWTLSPYSVLLRRSILYLIRRFLARQIDCFDKLAGTSFLIIRTSEQLIAGRFFPSLAGAGDREIFLILLTQGFVMLLGGGFLMLGGGGFLMLLGGGSLMLGGEGFLILLDGGFLMLGGGGSLMLLG